MSYFFAFMLAMFTATALIVPLMRWAERFRFVDLPEARKVHQIPVPRVGGIAMVISALLAFVLFLPLNETLAAFLLAIVVLFVFGVWDDRVELNHRLKFLGQIIAVTIVIFQGDVLIERIPFHHFEPIPYYFSVPLTYFALLGITNAINLSDGLDGLAGGTTLMSLVVVAVLAFVANDPVLTTICVIIMGSIFGFLRYNTYPARVFMGDTGSQFLGFSAGVLVVWLTQKTNIALSPAMPLMLLGFPILDTFMVMAHRIRSGQSPFVADKNHTHHKLLHLGFDHYEAVLIIYTSQALLVSGAYLMRYQLDWLIILVYGLFSALVVVFFQITHRIGWQAHRNAEVNEPSIVTRAVRWLVHEQRLPRWSFYIIATTIPIYLFLGALVSESFTIDIEVLALILLVVLVFVYHLQKGKPFSMLERACTYVTCTIIVYFMQTSDVVHADYRVLQYAYFSLLAVVVGLGMRFSKGQRFTLNTMDFLVILLAVSVPNLHMHGMLDREVSEGMAMLIVLFYGIEIVIMKLSGKSDILRYALYATLGFIGIKGFLII